jgi:hypothetical protein
MAIFNKGNKFKGGFNIGGVKHRHPLSSEEISYVLQILKTTTFAGDQLENLAIVTMKLQEEYKIVLEKEQKTA